MPGRASPTSVRTRRLTEFDASWKVKTLASGLQVVHLPSPNDDRFYLGAMIKAGTRVEEPERAGLAHFLEHMMFRGSERHPEFTQLAEAFEWLGGEWNAATGHEHTEYWYSGIRHTAPEVIDLFAEFLAKPKLKNLETERQIILREIEGDLNDFGHSTDLDHQMAGLLWPGTPLSLPILGTQETVEAIGLADLAGFRERHYVPRNMVVCAVGGGEDTLGLVERAFADYRVQDRDRPRTVFAPAPSAIGPLVRWVEHSDNEYSVMLSFRCEGEWSEKVTDYEIIARILADGFCSRLQSHLREKHGLVYDVDARSSHFVETGSIDITAGVHTDNLDRFMDELIKLLQELRDAGPTEDELRRAVLRDAVALELMPGEPVEVASKLCWSLLCDQPFSLLKERQRLEDLTRERVAERCREVFQPANAGLVLLGPARAGLEEDMHRRLAAL